MIRHHLCLSDEVTGWAVGFLIPFTSPVSTIDRPSCYVIFITYVVLAWVKSGDVARLAWLASAQR